MRLTVVGTGSSGNSYVLESGGKKLILDAGMRAEEIIRACNGLHDVVGCLVTHEHGDHSKSAMALIHYGVNVYTTHGTSDVMGIKKGFFVPFWHMVEMLEPILIDRFTVLPFPTEHDAQEPCGFLIKDRKTGEQVLYATDTYYLRNTFPHINFWIIECNYTDEILNKQMEAGLINRVLANRLRKSHMSLKRLKLTLKANDLTDTRKILLVHLSDGRSDEQQMVEEISTLTGKETIAVNSGMVIDLNLTPF